MYHRIVAVIVLCVQLCSSCTGRTEILEEIESAIHTDPGHALELINELSAESYSSKKTEAYHSLLRSMALDKAGIDIRNDSIISRALSYYSQKGSSLNRCRTFYYAARIHENNMDYETSMAYLYQAEKFMDDIDDNYLKSLICSSKGRLYFETMEYTKAASNYCDAAAYCIADSQTDRWAANKTREGLCRLQEKEYDAAREIVNVLKNHLTELPVSVLNKYYQLHLSLEIAVCASDNSQLISEYLKDVTRKDLIDWPLVAQACIMDNNAKDAFKYLAQHLEYYPKNAIYHYCMAQAQELVGNMEDAVHNYKSYIDLSGKIGKSILIQETEFIEEREMHLQMHEKEKNHRSILYLVISVILLALALAVAAISAGLKQRKIDRLERDELQRQIDGLMLEREELAMLENKNQEGRRIISERLRIIDQFVMSDAFNDSIFEAKASETLKEIISDRDTFVKQNRLIFNQASPEFIEYLTGKGLTDTEIDHCCLYAIGMNGKMVTTFTNAKRHYHLGSDVRKKLGLNPHDTNISIFIRNLYNKMESRES